ncbi:multidrug ABC transporter substrate-binding protein [Candidatus Saganbacteria bacterium CG08_land_8_20_14_0_20_45_16]|uniref:Multidrug ABC transporter substrate-binding protein n=1 Tax=Candidatus Saganbacteria bacterium CG08_land_8_20_14_0_20_45_16 TaxID=2014293 RepID=A0A2H0XUC9_UNCSA|nr:MAG: multidrug ABC transporter substrate-binding protein [Candidatus Saganbacteria bacterium CG08_land_8_20_14_0_20_45_16]
MNFWRLIKIAFRDLSVSRMRTFFTMLGVIIGIFSVITLISLGEGLKAYMRRQIDSYGTGSNYMELHAGTKGGGYFIGGDLTYADAKAIEQEARYVAEVDSRVMRSGEFTYGNKKFKTSFIMGASPYVQSMMNWEVGEGSFFSSLDVETRRRVVIIGKNIEKRLFGNFSAVGERIKLDGQNVQVIGVFAEKGSFMGFNYDDMALLPVTSASDLFGVTKMVEIGINAKSDKVVSEAKVEVKRILIKRHGQEDFRLDTMEESMSMVNTIMNGLTAIVAGIAAISLLVGGIGIANIMLVAVTERTQEIGIRKAVGARERDIILQFLAEAVVISFIGGAIGIVAGAAMALLIMYAIGFPLLISTWAVVLASTVSIFVGVVSGVYPAMRAGRLDPVEALRYE